MARASETAGTAAGTPALGAGVLHGALVRLTRTIRGRLLLLVFAVLIPAAAAAGVLLWDAYRAHRTETARQMRETSRAVSLAVDRQIGQAEASLRALATSPFLETGDSAAFDRQARRVAAGPDTWIVLEDGVVGQRVNTALPIGRAPAMKVSPTFAGRWARMRKDGRVISNLFTGAVTGKQVVAVEIPLTVGGRATSLQMLMTPHVPTQVLAEQHLPARWVGGVLDRDCRMVARSVDADKYIGRAATPEACRVIRSTASSIAETRTLEGLPVLTARSRSPVTGWTVFVAMPKDELNASVNRAVALAAVLGLALIALGAGLALWVARGVLRPVEALAGAARALGRGDSFMVGATGMRETDAVAAALGGASARLRAREDELRRLNETLEIRVQDGAERLVQAQKLEAMGRLTGGVAHDFNNLLTAVLGNLELLGRRISDERLKRYVSSARDAARRGASLTTQLLAFARKQRLDPAPLDVNQVVEAMGELLSSTLGGAIKVETRLGADAGLAMADRTQLELMILNLAINARDAMPGGGMVTIETGFAEITEDLPQASDPPPGRYVRLSVRDNGEGMTAEVLDRVLEPFFTTKGPGKGSGLGLPQALGVVQQLGGGLRIETAPGEGACIHLYLPVAAAGARVTAMPAASQFEGGLSGRIVLLVDDDIHVRQVTAALLRELGAVALEADGARGARARIEQGLIYDVALVDFAIPEVNGADLAAELQVLQPGAPVVIMTGFADSSQLAQGWDGIIIEKPFTPEILGQSLAGALARTPSAAVA